MSRAGSKQQVVRNTASNLIVLAVSSVVMLWFTPYLIRQLGLAVYGLVPLALSLSTYMGILTVGVQSAVGRYLTLEVAKGDKGAASRVMSTALIANLVVAGGIMPVILGVAIAAPRMFDVPAGHETDARWFFLFAMISYVCVAIREISGAASFASNRIDLQNVARLTEVFVRVGFVVAAFALRGPELPLVGLGMLVGAAASLVVALGAWRVAAPEVRFSVRFFERERLNSMLGTGGWVTVNHVGSLLHMATDVMVINIILGSAIAGAYGSVLQLSTFLRSLAGSLSAVLAPVLFAQYAQERTHALGVTAARAVKLLGMAIGLPAALVMGFGRPVLTLWLGPQFAQLVPVLIVMVVHLPYNYAYLPLDSVNMAYNRVKWPSVVGVVTGVVNVGLSVALARMGSWAIGVAVATLVSLTVRYGVFVPLYAAHVTGSKRSRFFGHAAVGTLLSIGFAAAAFALDRAVSISSWGELVIASAGVSTVYALVGYALLSTDDRTLLLSLVPGVKRA